MVFLFASKYAAAATDSAVTAKTPTIVFILFTFFGSKKDSCGGLNDICFVEKINQRFDVSQTNSLSYD